MSGIVLAVKTGPRDQSLVSFPKNSQAPAGVRSIFNFWQLNLALARSVQVINQDAANAATVIINNDQSNPVNLPPSSSIGLSDQWVEQIEVTAGAAGRCDVLAELVPREELLKRGNNL